MKKITNLLIVCSLALTGALMAQEPSPEQSPGKNKGPEKKAPAEVKPKAERPPKTEMPKTQAPKTEAPAVAPKTQAPAMKDATAGESPVPTKPEKKAPKNKKETPA